MFSSDFILLGTNQIAGISSDFMLLGTNQIAGIVSDLNMD